MKAGSHTSSSGLVESDNCNVFYTQQEHCDKRTKCLPLSQSQYGVHYISFHQGCSRQGGEWIELWINYSGNVSFGERIINPQRNSETICDSILSTDTELDTLGAHT